MLNPAHGGVGHGGGHSFTTTVISGVGRGSPTATASRYQRPAKEQRSRQKREAADRAGPAWAR